MGSADWSSDAGGQQWAWSWADFDDGLCGVADERSAIAPRICLFRDADDGSLETDSNVERVYAIEASGSGVTCQHGGKLKQLTIHDLPSIVARWLLHCITSVFCWTDLSSRRTISPSDGQKVWQSFRPRSRSRGLQARIGGSAGTIPENELLGERPLGCILLRLTCSN
jgi:hypothetical protein